MNDRLPLDEQVGEVVGYLVGDRYERISVRRSKPPVGHVAQAKGLVKPYEPQVHGTEEQRQREEPPTFDLPE
jgi:hypothetical protein